MVPSEKSSENLSEKEKRIKRVMHLHYSNPQVQKAIFEFCKNREVVPCFMGKAFGKRPDALQYPGDVFELVKKGATSFHCSQEIWKDPLALSTNLSREQLNELRKGWDLLIDIDSKYFDYSKVFAQLVIEFFRFHGLRSVGVKFSGSKGFHLIVPFEAFPEKVGNSLTKDMFPEWARIVANYLKEKTRDELVKRISGLSKSSKYVKDFRASEEVIPDLVLVSSRHLFRAPYSLHEKTSLVSVVIDPDCIKDFELKDADAFKVEVRDFYPTPKKNEAGELLREALDWYESSQKKEHETRTREYALLDFVREKIEVGKIPEENFPPCIRRILRGLEDGKKRALFALLNFFRSLNVEREDLENFISEWNSKNKSSLKEGYVRAQLNWSYRNKVVPPPNCKQFYQEIGVCSPDPLCSKIKNPLNYFLRKVFAAEKGKRKGKSIKRKRSPKKEN